MANAKFRKRLLTAFLALAFSAAGSPPFAEAGSVSELRKYLGKLTTLQAGRVSATAMEFLLKNEEEDITKAMAAIMAEAVRRDETEVQPEYKSDHEALKDVVSKDITAEMTLLYTAIIAADNNIFDSSVPRYRTPGEGQTIRFSEVYATRVGEWQNYALLYAITANNTQTSDATSVQTTIKALHDASLAARGYRQLLQSRHQTAIFMDQEISKLRTDIQRQIAVETWIAVNERQERADRQAAFDQAVSRGDSAQTAGKGY
ncbi:MAG: hypothetical protein LBO82_10400 [Synergistaceae bacterium]|jgi:hypothetical protein|nr:hypothetical protein [Synergistaceae bacterium]